MNTEAIKETDSATDPQGQVQVLVMQICANCADWESTDEKNAVGDCLVHDGVRPSDYPSDHSCPSFSPDPSRFCGICGAPAIEAEHSAMECTASEAHGASQWDYSWHDFSA